MAGSDLNVAFTSNTSGGTNKFTVSTSASAASGPVNIGLPDEGVKFSTNLQATLTNVAGLTAFHA